MRRPIVLAVLLTAGTLAAALGGVRPVTAQAEMVIDVEQVRDNLYVFRGGRGATPVCSSPPTASLWSTPSSPGGDS